MTFTNKGMFSGKTGVLCVVRAKISGYNCTLYKHSQLSVMSRLYNFVKLPLPSLCLVHAKGRNIIGLCRTFPLTIYAYSLKMKRKSAKFNRNLLGFFTEMFDNDRHLPIILGVFYRTLVVVFR